MFHYGNANKNQREAISAVKGPVLITAGPGTGKTYTLVQRTLFLITECDIAPENIFIATFTEKAAKELVTRITDELAKMSDDSYRLIDVKGDNKIDDSVVKAKESAAREMAVASGVEYIMYPGSVVRKTRILED